MTIVACALAVPAVTERDIRLSRLRRKVREVDLEIGATDEHRTELEEERDSLLAQIEAIEGDDRGTLSE